MSDALRRDSLPSLFHRAIGWRYRGAGRSLPHLHGRSVFLARLWPLVVPLTGVVARGVLLFHGQKYKKRLLLKPRATMLPRPFPASVPSPASLLVC